MAPGRNDPCPCGSGKKYKLCCLKAGQPARTAEGRAALAKEHFKRGNELRKKKRIAGAMDAYREAIRLKPDYGPALENLSGILQAANQHDEAVVFLKRAIEANPERRKPRLNLAFIYAQLGRTEDCERLVREMLRRNPTDVRALYRLSVLLERKLPDEDLRAICSLLETASDLPVRERQLLHAGLVDVYNARKEYGNAAKHAETANALDKQWRKEEGQLRDGLVVTSLVDRLIEIYSPEYFERVRDFGSDSVRPVFVVGLPRSGTTLAARIIGSHPRAFSAGELHLGKNAFYTVPHLLQTKEKPEVCAGRITSDITRRLANHHLHVLKLIDHEADRVVDKTPMNYLVLGLLVTMFPRAKIIHTRRDVRDVATSCWLKQFAKMFWACDKEWIATQIHQYRRIMDHWQRALLSPMLDFQYEEVVTDLETHARRLIDWVELPWDPACLEFHRSKGVVRTASIQQVRQPVYTRSVGRWRNYEDHLADLYALLEPAAKVAQ